MNIWFTSDIHFNHFNVIKYCNRPWTTVEDMNETIIKNYNSKVQPTDTCWILGDLTLASFKIAGPLIQRLNGKKFLVQGNHDKYSRGQYLALGFTEIFQEVQLKIVGHRLLLSHFPYKPSPEQLTEDLRYLDRRPDNKGSWLLHGHRHSNKETCVRSNMIDVGVDAWNYFPVSLQQIESILGQSSNGVAG